MILGFSDFLGCIKKIFILKIPKTIYRPEVAFSEYRDFAIGIPKKSRYLLTVHVCTADTFSDFPKSKRISIKAVSHSIGAFIFLKIFFPPTGSAYCGLKLIFFGRSNTILSKGILPYRLIQTNFGYQIQWGPQVSNLTLEGTDADATVAE